MENGSPEPTPGNPRLYFETVDARSGLVWLRRMRMRRVVGRHRTLVTRAYQALVVRVYAYFPVVKTEHGRLDDI